MGWLALQTELRELMHRIGLAMGLLSYLSETEKSIVLNGLAVGWLGFQTKLRDLMRIFEFAKAC